MLSLVHFKFFPEIMSLMAEFFQTIGSPETLPTRVNPTRGSDSQRPYCCPTKDSCEQTTMFNRTPSCSHGGRVQLAGVLTPIRS